MMQGFLEVVIGPKRWGKSYYLVGRSRALADSSSVRTVFYFDPTSRLAGERGFVEFTSFDEYEEHYRETDRWARMYLLRCGERPESYRPFLQHAIYHGHCAVILDEASIFAPSPGPKTLIPELAGVAVMCRGIPDRHGIARPIYVIAANQRAMSLNPVIRDNADILVVGKLRGRADRDWLRAVYDTKALDQIDALELHHWAVIEPPGGSVPPTA